MREGAPPPGAVTGLTRDGGATVVTQTLAVTGFLLARIDEDEARARSVGDDRLLRECEAKRRIVDEHRMVGAPRAGTWRDGCCWRCAPRGQFGGPCPTLRALVAVYGGHPDCREGWLPDPLLFEDVDED